MFHSRVPDIRFPARGGLRTTRPCRRTCARRPFAGDNRRNGTATGQPECGGHQVVSYGKCKTKWNRNLQFNLHHHRYHASKFVKFNLVDMYRNIPLFLSGRHAATERRTIASQSRCHVSFAGPDGVGGSQLSGGVTLAARRSDNDCKSD